MPNYFKQRLRSFKFAFRGICTLIKETPNAQIHLVLAATALILGFMLKISTAEWMAIIIVSGAVLAFEAVNSSIEMLADFVSPTRSHRIKKVKDLAAAAVLLISMAALIVGIIIFAPKITAYLAH